MCLLTFKPPNQHQEFLLGSVCINLLHHFIFQLMVYGDCNVITAMTFSMKIRLKMCVLKSCSIPITKWLLVTATGNAVVSFFYLCRALDTCRVLATSFVLFIY